MKNIKYIIIFIAITAAFFTACSKNDFLDRASTNQLQDKDIYTSWVQTDLVVNDLYSKLPKVYGYLGGYQMGSATDESKDASNWMWSMVYNTGGISPSRDFIVSTWKDYYKMVRQANGLLAGIEKYKTPDNPNNAGYLTNRIGEIYFLRAYAYFELARNFGGVPVVTTYIEDPNDDAALKIPRAAFDSVVAQIASDCDAAYAKVENYSYEDRDYGRVTKAACLALKSRIYLYAASPLWAVAGKTSAKPDISDNKTATDAAKWKMAADAAKQAIDYAHSKGSTLEANLGSRKNMYLRPWDSKEVLWVRMNEEGGSEFERHYFPFGYSGWSAGAPTQNVVDDYEMKDGKSIKTSPLYNPARPYNDRDPRLYSDILYNGASFKGRNVETYEGGRDEQSTATDHSRTGYYMRKLVDEAQTVGQTSRTTNGIVFRLAELYLNYAEAMNEYAPGDASILTALNPIRNRAGMPDVVTGFSQSEMRDKIRNERRIELLAENHRFWDVRRWKIAAETEQMMYGMKPVRDAAAPDGFKYERFLVERRPWTNALLVMPVPLDEMYRNKNLQQNPGW